MHVGTVDRVVGDRIKLTKEDGGEGHHKGHHHYISGGLVATVEDGTVRLSANADVAITFEEEEGEKPEILLENQKENAEHLTIVHAQ